MATPSKDRVRKHRTWWSSEGFVRLEVTLHRGLIEEMRQLAKRKKVPVREAVHDALEAFLATGNAGVTEANSLQNR